MSERGRGGAPTKLPEWVEAERVEWARRWAEQEGQIERLRALASVLNQFLIASHKREDERGADLRRLLLDLAARERGERGNEEVILEVFDSLITGERAFAAFLAELQPHVQLALRDALDDRGDA